MKTLWSSRNLFILGFLVLLATNAFVLKGVASNRADSESLVTLTERELQLPYRLHKENSGLFLNLQWRTLSKKDDFYSYSNGGSPAWLNETKLQTLGYNNVELDYYRLKSSYESRNRKPLSKEVFIVLEADSDLHDEVIKQAQKAFEKQKALLAIDDMDKRVRNDFERAEQKLNRERISASRLYAIDAGLNLTALRQQYADTTRFIIAKGLVQPNYVYNKDKRLREVSGYIKRLAIEKIHIPLKQRKLFDQFLNQNTTHRANNKAPRFQVELAYGRRLEPWVVEIKPFIAE